MFHFFFPDADEDGEEVEEEKEPKKNKHEVCTHYSERPKSKLVRFLAMWVAFGFWHCTGPICPIDMRII